METKIQELFATNLLNNSPNYTSIEKGYNLSNITVNEMYNYNENITLLGDSLS